MTAEALFALALLLEAEELLGADNTPLTRDDIFPVLDALQARGAELERALTIEPDA
jgi:hypothetical protein